MNNLDPDSTSPSLIVRAKRSDNEAWERLSKLYTPLVYQWARAANLGEHDIADVVQEVFQAVSKDISKFQTGEGQPPFRSWLWGITRHKIKDHFRKKHASPNAEGGSQALERFAELPEIEPDSESEPGVQGLTKKDSLAFRALQMIKSDFEEKTWQAFWRVTIESQSPADVASDLAISVGSVYTAKSRVLAHLRRELKGLS